jgi:hypothetical protein
MKNELSELAKIRIKKGFSALEQEIKYQEEEYAKFSIKMKNTVNFLIVFSVSLLVISFLVKVIGTIFAK